MLIEIKRNSHIKIRERNRLLTYMCMHGPNCNEMLETKENILRLTYIMKINQLIRNVHDVIEVPHAIFEVL
jgi:hypothetical protein